MGAWALLGVDPATNAALAGCEKGCPFVGPRLGALAFQVYPWENPWRRQDLVCGLIKEGRDGIVHRPSGRSWPAIALHSYRLESCLGKVCLDDGALLLTRNHGPYASSTCETIAAPLLAAIHDREADPWQIWWAATCHNPLRLASDDGRETQIPFHGADRVLREASVDLWLYDFDNLEELMDDDENSPWWWHAWNGQPLAPPRPRDGELEVDRDAGSDLVGDQAADAALPLPRRSS
jgi:hypothetical protein